MTVYLVFALGLAATLVVGAVIASRLVGRGAQLGGLGRRARTVADVAIVEFTPVGGYVVVALAGLGAVLTLMWLGGELLAATESFVDVPVFEWARDRQAGGWWDDVFAVLTQMGNRPETHAIVVIGSLGFAILWRRHRPWIPPLLLLTTYVGERFGQLVLARAVDRGHPPTSMGTYPSGGCARLITIWGIVLVLASLTWSVSRLLRTVAWTVLGALAFIEGYARTYRLEHWFTDVVGGWVFGVFLLIVFATAASALCRAHPPPAGSR